MKIRVQLTIACLTLATLPAAAIDAPLPRHPAPSPDGARIAFSWQGDIWTVAAAGGRATRLTAHPASERYPVYSRDGKWLAFASDRHGSFDVFVMPVDGSAAPRRLSFASVDDTPVDFTADGAAVLFVSSRAISPRWMPGLYSVPVDGGTPALAQSALAQQAVVAPDGSAVAFVRGATPWTRRGYRGAANRELWLATAADEYTRLTDFDGDDDCPSWVDGHTLAFRSARDGRKNVFLLHLVDGSSEALTNHQGSDVRFPRAAADGSLIAYEFEDGIWTVGVGADRQPTRLHIEVPGDVAVNAVEHREDARGASEMAVAPKGGLVAFVVHGDVFISELLSKEDQELVTPQTVRVTATNEREQGLSWAPDGSALLFSSARDGNDELYLARPESEELGWLDSMSFPVERLTDDPRADLDGRFDPSGDAIAWVRGRGDLVVRSLGDGAEKVILEHWTTPDFAWSPDGRWIAYSIPDMHYNAELWLVPSAGGEAYNVSRHPDVDEQPRWSPDGRRLFWVSRRHADTYDVWAVWLRQADHQRTAAEWLREWKNRGDEAVAQKADAEKGAADDSAAEDQQELPQVVIDFDRLWERAVALTALNGDEALGVVGEKGQRVFFVAEENGETDLFSVRWDGDDLKRLTDSDVKPLAVALDADKKTLFLLDGKGQISRLGVDGAPGDPVPFLARYEVDMRAERGAVFDEAWRELDRWFYDPDFHGVDWQLQHRVYRPWAFGASHEDDFYDVMNLLVGEMNASHMAYRVRSEYAGEKTGFIGVDVDPSAGGPGLLVTAVLPDSPADRFDVAVEPGERLLAVNGREITASTNLFELFAGTVGQKVRLKVEDVDGERRTVVIRPGEFDAEERLRYAEWVRQRRAMVDELSAGRLGYIHIESMNIPSFEVFEQSLMTAGEGKEGLVIDVRSNGGGWTTDYLMAVLDVRRHAFTVARGADSGTRAYPQSRLPLAAWTRPAITLCNEDSYSNAEIFSYAFKELKRGKLVGSPTFGAVISTGGSYLINGGWIRLPNRGWYVASTGMNMENNGAQPDVEVWMPPAEDTSATRDTQLARAVEELLADLATDPRAGAW